MQILKKHLPHYQTLPQLYPKGPEALKELCADPTSGLCWICHF